MTKVQVSNKSCRQYYTKGPCKCPPNECWYLDQVARQAHNKPIQEVHMWLLNLQSDPHKKKTENRH